MSTPTNSLAKGAHSFEHGVFA